MRNRRQRTLRRAGIGDALIDTTGFFRMSLKLPVRVAATLALAFAAAELCVWLRTPLPWMIGPLLATAMASVAGLPTVSWTPLRNAAQWTIGTALGLYFTPSVTSLIASIWWAVALGVVWALLVGLAFGAWLHRVHAVRMPGLSRATTYFAGAIGGASEMTLLAEREGARTDLVASSHSLRILVVAVSVPFAMQYSGLHGLYPAPAMLRVVDPIGLAWLALFTGLGALAVRQLGRANPWFMGALLVAMGLTVAGRHYSAVPQWMSNAAQLLIGVSLGVRFTGEFLRTAPRWLATVVFGTLGMIAACGAFAWLLSVGTGLHVATLILGTSPGGIAEMAITAKVLELGVPVVTAFQVCRLVTVLILVDPVYRYFYRKLGD
jgi:hypothetical protein